MCIKICGLEREEVRHVFNFVEFVSSKEYNQYRFSHHEWGSGGFIRTRVHHYDSCAKFRIYLHFDFGLSRCFAHVPTKFDRVYKTSVVRLIEVARVVRLIGNFLSTWRFWVELFKSWYHRKWKSSNDYLHICQLVFCCLHYDWELMFKLIAKS